MVEITTRGTAEYFLETGADDDIALVDGDLRHTYRELRRAVATLTSRLWEADLPPQTPVVLLAPNGLFWVAAYLAVMQAGHIAVPLPAGLSADEVAGRLTWVGARAALIATRFAALLGSTLPVGMLTLTEWALEQRPVEWEALPAASTQLDDDASYLFTSGTTGDPRAVRLTHRNIRANTESILAYLDLRSSDRVLVVLPFTYVFGASLLHTHLRAGATLVNQRSVAYPETTVQLLTAEQCTVFAGVPSVYHVLLRNSSFARTSFPQLRIIQQAGGRLPPALLDEMSSSQPQAQIFVMYGQTEATARLSALPPGDLPQRRGSIGRGIPGVSLRVVNDAGVEVAPGAVGEIWATGENISPGYLRDPEASMRKMPDGTLHTGDLATVDEDGFIYIVDRAEDFIKTWGHRVASQEVEAAAMELRDLVAVAAVGVLDDAAGERVELLAVRRPGSDISAADIVAHCRQVLPKFSVPVAAHFATTLPTNANGKIVKREARRIVSAIVAGREDDGNAQ